MPQFIVYDHHQQIDRIFADIKDVERISQIFRRHNLWALWALFVSAFDIFFALALIALDRQAQSTIAVVITILGLIMYLILENDFSRIEREINRKKSRLRIEIKQKIDQNADQYARLQNLAGF